MSRDPQRLNEKIVAYYEQTAGSYRSWGGPGPYQIHFGFRDSSAQSHHDTLLRMNEVLAEAAGILPGERILDAGCGVGGSALWLAETRNAEVWGIALPACQVEEARAFAWERGLSVRFFAGDYTDTRLPDRSFDVVWALESVCHAPCKPAFILEAHRLLRPGGRLAVADYFLVRAAGDLREIERYALEKWLEGWALPGLSTRQGFVEAMERAGFARLEARDITSQIQSSSKEIFARGKEGYPDDILTRSRSVLQMKHVEANMFQNVALELGIWRYLIVTGYRDD